MAHRISSSSVHRPPETSPMHHGLSLDDRQNSRSELLLLLGAVSLFLGGPLGITACILGTSDLRKIREGIMVPRRVLATKIGRVLGIGGTILFGVAVGMTVFLFSRGIISINALTIKGPLPIDQIAFVGEWFGQRGTVIRIGRDGTGEYRARHASVSGGKVLIIPNSVL